MLSWDEWYFFICQEDFQLQHPWSHMMLLPEKITGIYHSMTSGVLRTFDCTLIFFISNPFISISTRLKIFISNWVLNWLKHQATQKKYLLYNSVNSDISCWARWLSSKFVHYGWLLDSRIVWWLIVIKHSCFYNAMMLQNIVCSWVIKSLIFFVT